MKLKGNPPLILHALGHLLRGFFIPQVYNSSVREKGPSAFTCMSRSTGGKERMDIRKLVSTGAPKSIRWAIGKN